MSRHSTWAGSKVLAASIRVYVYITRTRPRAQVHTPCRVRTLGTVTTAARPGLHLDVFMHRSSRKLLERSRRLLASLSRSFSSPPYLLLPPPSPLLFVRLRTKWNGLVEPPANLSMSRSRCRVSHFALFPFLFSASPSFIFLLNGVRFSFALPWRISIRRIELDVPA